MPVIILDRDGVINFDSEEYIKSPEEWHPIPGSLEAIAKFNRAGYRVIIATNQSGVARGFYDISTLMKIHEKLLKCVEEAGGRIEEIFYCPHHPDEKCFCRKPQPGMLNQIAKKYSVDMANTFFIGDSMGDVKAAQLAGCRPLLVLTGNGKKTLGKYPELMNTLHYKDLAEAAEAICTIEIPHHTGGCC